MELTAYGLLASGACGALATLYALHRVLDLSQGRLLEAVAWTTSTLLALGAAGAGVARTLSGAPSRLWLLGAAAAATAATLALVLRARSRAATNGETVAPTD